MMTFEVGIAPCIHVWANASVAPPTIEGEWRDGDHGAILSSVQARLMGRHTMKACEDEAGDEASLSVD